jgi:hypothetical protein
MTPSLTELREAVDRARAKLEGARAQHDKTVTTQRIAQGTLDSERHQRALSLSRGGPRAAPNAKLPKTPVEIAADSAQAKADAAEMQRDFAQNELAKAEAAVLTEENRILNKWRDTRAVAIKAAQLAGADAAEMIEALRAACPPDSMVRINQRFVLSALVREVLNEFPDHLRVDTPSNILRGEGHAGYEDLRAQILVSAAA